MQHTHMRLCVHDLKNRLGFLRNRGAVLGEGESAGEVKGLGGTGDGQVGVAGRNRPVERVGGRVRKTTLNPRYAYFLCASDCFVPGIETEGPQCELQAKWVRT